jgi:hypothetical protein
VVNDDNGDNKNTAALKSVSQVEKPKKVKDYLDTLDRETAARVSSLISLVEENGFKAAIAEAQAEDPFVLDAFHDALVGKLYHELKDRGLIQ